MNTRPANAGTRRCPPRGATLVEGVVAIALAAVTLGCLAQLLSAAANQRRSGERRTLATWEAGNAMEDLMSRPWSELASGKPPTVELSARCRETLPEARLHVEVTPDGDDARRIAVRIEWRNEADQPVTPVRLVAWRYRETEARP